MTSLVSFAALIFILSGCSHLASSPSACRANLDPLRLGEAIGSIGFNVIRNLYSTIGDPKKDLEEFIRRLPEIIGRPIPIKGR